MKSIHKGSQIRLGILIVTFFVVFLVLSACGTDKPNDFNWQVQDFQYTDQNGQAFGLADLKNKVWIVNFIFTHCTTVCPPMTANMTKLQEKMKEAGVQAEIVSFSVDPEVDTPEILKNYVSKFNADLSYWHLLSGYTDKEIQEFAKTSFKTIVQKDTTSDQVIHGTSFFMVDSSGTVVTKYDGLEPDFNKIVKDIKALQP